MYIPLIFYSVISLPMEKLFLGFFSIPYGLYVLSKEN